MRETILMLPPLPGTDTAHPAFWMFADDFPCFDRDYPRNDWRGLCVQKMNIIAAAAIAHYWYEQKQEISTDNVEVGMWLTKLENNEFNRRRLMLWTARDQYCHWRSIASGYRDFDNCKIVAYAPRETK